MKIKTMIKKVINFAGYGICENYHHCYDQEGLLTVHNHDFMQEPRFAESYRRAEIAGEEQPSIHWRTHVAIWTAQQALRVEGDFVECGVCKGFLSTAIMHYLDWNKLGRRCFLFDTFRGLEESLLSDEEKKMGRMAFSGRRYGECFETTKKNFSGYKDVQLVRGPVPDTLATVEISRVAYLHLDMNCAAPEIATLRHFWPKISPGGFVLLDDYAFRGFEPQKRAFDSLASELGFSILSIPTGQGLIVHP